MKKLKSTDLALNVTKLSDNRVSGLSSAEAERGELAAFDIDLTVS